MNRTFTVVDSTTQKTSTFQSTAETLAELKADLRAHGINYNGMTIYEGISKTELKSDNSALPHDVPYKGGTTNNLVFRLTKSEKNIKSGAMSRPEAYAAVKKLGLQDAVKLCEATGFTNVVLPPFQDGKDISDLYKHVGRGRFLEIIRPLFGIYCEPEYDDDLPF